MFHDQMRTRYKLVLASLVLVTQGVIADESCVLPPTVTSESLISFALSCNPGHRAINERWQARKYEQDVAGRWDDPMLSVSAAPQTCNDHSIDDGYIVEFRQPIPWAGITASKEGIASSKTALWEANVRQDEIALAREIRIRYA